MLLLSMYLQELSLGKAVEALTDQVTQDLPPVLGDIKATDLMIYSSCANSAWPVPCAAGLCAPWSGILATADRSVQRPARQAVGGARSSSGCPVVCSANRRTRCLLDGLSVRPTWPCSRSPSRLKRATPARVLRLAEYIVPDPRLSIERRVAFHLDQARTTPGRSSCSKPPALKRRRTSATGQQPGERSRMWCSVVVVQWHGRRHS